MIIHWKPDPSAEPIELSFKPFEMLSPEAELIEAVGMGAWDTWDGWHRKFRAGHKLAERVALWIARRRDDPGLQLADVTVRMDGMWVTFDLDEIRERRQELIDRKFTDEWTPEMLGIALDFPYLRLPEGEVDAGPLPPSGEQSSTTPTDPAAPGTDT